MLSAMVLTEITDAASGLAVANPVADGGVGPIRNGGKDCEVYLAEEVSLDVRRPRGAHDVRGAAVLKELCS